LPDTLAKYLIAEKELRFHPVPEPSQDELIQKGYFKKDRSGAFISVKKEPGADEWAGNIWGKMPYQIPQTKEEMVSIDKPELSIQTLLYPYELETRLRYLLQKSKSSIEETGANILYMAFGFLEWFDPADKHKKMKRLAPLFLIPVQLKKGRLNKSTSTYDYTIKYTEEEIIQNISLLEKLRVDFNLSLPDLAENLLPEQYLQAVQQKIIQKNQPEWKLHRYVTLSLFNFSKLLMYLDLSPDRWPSDYKITDHEIVSLFIEGSTESQSNDIQENYYVIDDEYQIDDIADVHHKYPLIEDADSSQHSALIDSLKGKHLVIEGPPGTGKSQTITNLIGAAMAHNKTVLFVAEKLAALEVVKRRLDKAGLGDFCLEMHSHKSQKKQVLDSIKKRLNKKGTFRSPSEIDAEIAQFEKLKTKLKFHAEIVNTPYKNTAKTIHDILTGASRYRKKINMNPKTIHPKGLNGDNFDPIVQRETKELFCSYINIYKALINNKKENASIKNHPWYGIRNTHLSSIDEDSVLSTLSSWQASIEKLMSFKDDLSKTLNCNTDDLPDTLKGLDVLCNEMAQLPELNGNELLFSLPALQGNHLIDVQNMMAMFHEIQDAYQESSTFMDLSILDTLEQIQTFRDGIDSLKKLTPVSPDFDTIKQMIQISTNLNDLLPNISQWVADITKRIGAQTKEFFPTTESGLKEFKQYLSTIAALKLSLWKNRDPVFENEELDRILPIIRKEFDRIHALRNELQQIINVDALPELSFTNELRDTIENGGKFRWLKKDWRTARKTMLAFRVNKRVKFRKIRPQLEKISEYIESKFQFEHNKDYTDLLSHFFKGLDTQMDDLEDISTWYRQIQSQYGVCFGRKIPLKDSIIQMPIDVVEKMHDFLKSGVGKQLENVLDQLNQLKTIFSLFKDLQNENHNLVNAIQKLNKTLIHSCNQCEPVLSDTSLSIDTISERIALLEKLKENLIDWEKSDLIHQVFQGQIQLNHGLDMDNENALNCIHNTLSLACHLDQKMTDSLISKKIYEQPDESIFQQLNEISVVFRNLLDDQQNQCKNFINEVELNYDEWAFSCNDSLTLLFQRNQNALNHVPALHQWLAYLGVYAQLVESGFIKLVDCIDHETIPLHNAESAYYAATYDCLAMKILQKYQELEKFSGHIHENYQKQFSEYDQNLKKLQSKRIAWEIDQKVVPRGNFGGRVSEYTECSLLEHECNKKMRHIPIRQIIKRATRSLLALKPCFMMGPMSVSHYLKPGEIVFDIVIMDEASQIKPEDALGIIARGKQLIIVGDPKQLPPTTFFERIIDDTGSDVTAIEESKSILDAALPMFPLRRLRWHYRSAHESLIAFSNHYFYDDHLILFPSPHSKSDNLGIQYTRVNGSFVNRRNREESIEISHAVREHFIKHKDESLGVVAMNSTQQNDIEQVIEELSKEDALFQRLLEKDQKKHEALFIKNLENVQGDERDVIFISMTYGPQTPGGKVFQRFGPINSSVGHRRLNVLFTRSRKRMNIFSSMNASDILVGPSSSRGVKAFRDFLKYAETGELDQTIDFSERPPDSDFEIDVAESLHKEGFQCTAQVGVAGFFIDIAVKDPGNPGQYLMGIECDGASYHSMKSTRDRDRLRQNILEQKGWCIRRIWSTDWYKNPEVVIQPIIQELKEMMSSVNTPN
jgi:superfamily I DNA and/or RNA helicase/very-short-patch-repair endonuclease